MSTPKYWLGTPPTHCQLSGYAIDTVFYDCVIGGHGWALLGQRTFDQLSCVVGVGKGQKYELQGDGRWLKTAG